MIDKKLAVETINRLRSGCLDTCAYPEDKETTDGAANLLERFVSEALTPEEIELVSEGLSMLWDNRCDRLAKAPRNFQPKDVGEFAAEIAGIMGKLGIKTI